MNAFTMKVLRGNEVIAEFEGRPMDPDFFRLSDLHAVIELEQRLERMYGLRFHINYIQKGAPKDD